MGSQEALSIREEDEETTPSPEMLEDTSVKYNKSVHHREQTSYYSSQSYSHTAESSFASGVDSRNAMSHGKAPSVMSNFSNQSGPRVSDFDNFDSKFLSHNLEISYLSQSVFMLIFRWSL